MDKEIVKTDDGSNTIFLPELNEHYHSTFGAINESQHVFVNSGFKALNAKDVIYILEVGFGTGLNALLTLIEAQNKKIEVHYIGIESNPVGKVILEKLNYPVQIDDENAENCFRKIHKAEWGTEVEIYPEFFLTKVNFELQEVEFEDTEFDLIYFDAFAPDIQPELWTSEIFNKLYLQMAKGGCLVTYSAKGAVKRALKEVGFEIEGLPGPKGKREITRAWKR
ncbi:MAG: tRNA (5-methylaminomethyl-2-thiouridine)(34)-methyltransferase MnmD [Bacteroidetes bacterium]|nr:tRNA (5-methylaminomethyl-2-thiouridine)(34)-methyltransferase MnmD [Bacteroidota bacterium]